MVKRGRVLRGEDSGAKHRYFADLLAGDQQLILQSARRLDDPEWCSRLVPVWW